MHIPEFIVICFPQKLMLEYLRVVQLAAEKATALITNTLALTYQRTIFPVWHILFYYTCTSTNGRMLQYLAVSFSDKLQSTGYKAVANYFIMVHHQNS